MALNSSSSFDYTKATTSTLTEPKDGKKGTDSVEPVVDHSQFFGPYASLTSYRMNDLDNTAGLFIATKNNSIHFTTDGNLIQNSGKPSQSGCGGKNITKAEEIIQKSKGVYIEVTGPDEAGVKDKEATEDGTIEETKDPSYSLKIYGDCWIECVGGDVKIKGDNVTLNAQSTLNLTSGKDINIQAGEKGGKINLTGGTVTMDCSFLKNKVKSGIYNEGAPEIVTNQKKIGSDITLNTFGLNHNITGNQTTNITGNYKFGVTGWRQEETTLSYGLRVGEDYSLEIEGKSKINVKGVKSKSAEKSNYVVDVGTSKTKTFPSFRVDSGGPIGMTSSIGGFEFSVGAGKKVGSSLSFDEKQGKWEVGTKLGYLSLDAKGAEIGYTKAVSLKLSAANASLSAPAIFLN